VLGAQGAAQLEDEIIDIGAHGFANRAETFDVGTGENVEMNVPVADVAKGVDSGICARFVDDRL
jgi:hypothetical protein